jgi:transcriptional regulator with XRE-family HTH domain
MSLRDVFARNLRRYRLSVGLSQEALAADAEVDRTYVSALERGIYAASIDMIERLSKVLEVEPSKLLERPQRGRSP